MKRLFKATLTQGMFEQETKLNVLIWANSEREVYDKLTPMLKNSVFHEIKKLKWWQWK